MVGDAHFGRAAEPPGPALGRLGRVQSHGLRAVGRAGQRRGLGGRDRCAAQLGLAPRLRCSALFLLLQPDTVLRRRQSCC
jgi:hypothetical protein